MQPLVAGNKRITHMVHLDKSLNILFIEDPANECDALYQELLKLDFKIIFSKVASASDLLNQLKTHSWNLIISDFGNTVFPSLEALIIVRAHSQELPFILVTEKMGEENVADMMKAGVEDVVLKSRPGRIRPIIKRILCENDTKNKEEFAHKMATEAFAAKEQMIAIVSHDIKNPLSAIQLEAQMLLRAVSRSPKSILGEEVKIQANRILKTTDRMKLLIADLLDRSKSENSLTNLSKITMDVETLIQEAIDSLRPLLQQKEILIKRSFSSRKSVVSLDRNKMFQVLSNLLNNAIKFTPEKGTIHISLEEHYQELIISIMDSGPGLNDIELTRVFEKYWMGNNSQCPGTGLGLFICKTIVEAHGGHIDAENIPGQGARFCFSLPRIDQEQVAFSYYDAHKDKRKKVYIVDDDEDLREVISWALGQEGYSIHSFNSPKEALDCLIKGKHLPNLMVVDFHMDEMNGSEFLVKKYAIAAARNCPVVMISASPQEIEGVIKRELYSEVITKPIDLEALINNVKKFIN